MSKPRGPRKWIYARGQALWCRVKTDRGDWINRNTGFKLGDEVLAKSFATTLQDNLDQKHVGCDPELDLGLPDDLIKTPRGTETCIIPSARAPNGLIYIVQMLPEVAPWRIKIGHTRMTVGKRLNSYRTLCPNAVVLAFWAGSTSQEQTLLRSIDGRIRKSEVFDCDNLESVLVRVDRLLGTRLGGLTLIVQN